LRRLIIPCVSNAFAGHILKRDVRCMQIGVSICWVVAAIGLWFGVPACLVVLSNHSKFVFQKAAGRIRIHDVMLFSATCPIKLASA
jgi:hypothetical protein